MSRGLCGGDARSEDETAASNVEIENEEEHQRNTRNGHHGDGPLRRQQQQRQQRGDQQVAGRNPINRRPTEEDNAHHRRRREQVSQQRRRVVVVPTEDVELGDAAIIVSSSDATAADNDAASHKDAIRAKGDRDTHDRTTSSSNSNNKMGAETEASALTSAAALAACDVFVTWNVGRNAEGKAAAIERLIIECQRPAFVALQEIGKLSAEVSSLAAVCRERGYALFVQERAGKNSKAHGGAALLVRTDIAAQSWSWREAEAWSDECEVVSVRVAPCRGPPFIVSSWYVHGASDDADGFRRVLFSARDDQIILGDLNAQLPGSRSGDVVIAQPFAERGRHLAEFICERSCMYPTPSGPTRRSRAEVQGDDGATRKVRLDDGSINDHVVVGSSVFEHIEEAATDAVVLSNGDWPSDHEPLVWSARIGLADIAASSRRTWCRVLQWHKITDEHRRKFNVCVRRRLTLAAQQRRLDMLAVESAIATASASALPHVWPWSDGAEKRGLFWTDAARRRVDEMVAARGDGAVAHVSHAYSKARREVLAENAEVSSNPTSCWSFVKRFYGFGRAATLRPPLETGEIIGDDGAAGARTTVDAEERVEVLARHYAAVHSSPEVVDAQSDLQAVVGSLPKWGDRDFKWHALSLTELRVCIAAMATGKCADPMGLRVEHLRLLDDESLRSMLPFVDRCLSHAALPSHWLSSVVTPVPKRGRDLSLRRSWRPVSVTALLCRVCENVVNNRVQHAIESQGARRGESQFGFRRGVGTSLPLSGLSMFINDGFRQDTKTALWDATGALTAPTTTTTATSSATRRSSSSRPSKTTLRPVDTVLFGTQAGAAANGGQHVTLLVSIDASDAFCRALPAKVLQKLAQLRVPAEARWIARLLSDRTLMVKEDGVLSRGHALERGTPQGSVLSPLLWSLVIDDLIAECEAACREPLAGCVAVPIVFADDINFAIRGFNPSSMVEQANALLRIVRRWAEANAIPMAKLQATWITGQTQSSWAALWEKKHGEIIYDDAVRCVPGRTPLKLLGVTFDSDFNFGTHVNNLVEQCERYSRLLAGMSGIVKQEKLLVLYRGMILSRMLYAVDAWYPYCSAADQRRLQSLHYRACCSITGCLTSSHAASVCYEAGLRMFAEIARDETVKLADRLRRMPHGGELLEPRVCFGPEWVARLFCDGVMPTARLRTVLLESGEARKREPDVWPTRGWRRSSQRPDAPDGCALRDVGIGLDHDDPRSFCDSDDEFDPRSSAATSLRPLARVHPWAPHELAVFDTAVRFFVDPPGGLIKGDLDALAPEERRQREGELGAANAQRMDELVRLYGDDAVFVFTDGARAEGDAEEESCAGAFVICRGPDPTRRECRLRTGHVKASPIACVYSAELGAIDAALACVEKEAAAWFKRRGGNRNVVLVTDSRSSLESVRTSWLCRIDRLEQDVARRLFSLAAHKKLRVALAFVFSHVGGVAGNEFVDKRAQQACTTYGGTWTDSLWHVDTTRRILRKRHDEVDVQAGSLSSTGAVRAGTCAFRFEAMPGDTRCRPSPPLPREIPRYQEKLLYRARVGMLPAAGGLRHGVMEECPLCGEPELGRNGATVRHIAACLPAFTSPSVEIDLESLWTEPAEAAAQLAFATAFVADTPRGRERTAQRQQQKQQQRRHRSTSAGIKSAPRRAGQHRGG